MIAPLTIKAALMCDEVRREDNGKGFFIGVYQGDVTVKEFPAALRLTWVLLAQPRRSTEREMEFKLTYDENTEDPKTILAKLEIQSGPLEGMEEVQIILPDVVLTFNGPTTLTLSLKDDEQWNPIARKNLMLARASGTIEPSRPS